MKKIILILMVVSLGFSAFAQDKEAVKDTTKAPKVKMMMNKFQHNWDLSVVVGTNAFLGEYVFHYKSLDMFTFPYVDVNVQKWLTPVWSIGLGLDFAKFKTLYDYKNGNLNWFSDVLNDKPYPRNPDFYYATGSMVGIYFKTSCDMAYLVSAYDEHRVFHPIAYVGGGFLVPMNKMAYRPVGLMAIAGVLFNFQISPHFLIGLNLEGNFISDNFDGRCPIADVALEENNLRVDANQKFGINLTYRFGFVKTKNPVTGANERHPWIPVQQDAVDAGQLNQELAQAKQAAAQAQSDLEKANAAVAEAQKEAKEAAAAAAEAEKNAQAATAAAAAGVAGAVTPSATEDSLRAKIDRLQLQLSYAQEDLALARIDADKAKADLEKAQNTNKETVVKESYKESIYERDTIGYWQIVTFPIDKWVITNRERVNIMAAADMIKATPNVNYVLTGYADMQTATAERNWFLSEKRANAVLKVLVEEYGIPAERLSIDFKGGVENLYFHDVECSRSVVIAPAK